MLWGLSFIFALAVWLGTGLRRSILAVVPMLVCFSLGMAVAFVLLRNLLAPPWYDVLLAILVGIVIGYFATWMWHARFEKSALINGFRIGWQLIFGDFRVAAVLIGLLLSYVLTFYFAIFAKAENPAGFWAAFYPAWVSGLLFFTVVGLIAGLVTLYRPERDVFAARVKILLGGKSGPAADFIASELKRVGYVARHTERIVTIEDYDASMGAFKVNVWHSSTIRNIYDDIQTEAVGQIAINPDPVAPAPALFGQLTSFSINGTNQPDVPFEIKQDGFNRRWALPIPGGGEGTVEYEHWYWYKASERHHFTLSRFTEELKVQFHCRCSPDSKKVLLKLTTGADNSEHVLGWDQRHPIKPLKNQSPATVPYEFRLGISP